jgi:hypothetical protein
MSTQFDELKAAYESFRNDIVVKVTELQTKVTDLRNQLESVSADPVAVDQLLKEIEADHLALIPPAKPTADVVEPSA